MKQESDLVRRDFLLYPRPDGFQQSHCLLLWNACQRLPENFSALEISFIWRICLAKKASSSKNSLIIVCVRFKGVEGNRLPNNLINRLLV